MNMIDTDNNKNVKENNNKSNFTTVTDTMQPTIISTTTTTTEDGVIIIEWDDLIIENNNFNTIIEQAYGNSSSIGIVAVRNVPNFVQAKQLLFPKIYTVAVQLSNEYREKYLTHSESLYNTGWSYGKEKIGIHKVPDTNKGSYYFNPITDTPGSDNDRINYPYSYPINIWPSNDVLPGFETAAKELGTIIANVAIIVTKHIDTYVHNKNNDYPINFLYNHLHDTDKVKGRLLYYYPFDDNNDNDNDTCTSTTNDSSNNCSSSTQEDSWVSKLLDK